MCLTHSLPIGIISTRIFEALGSGAVGLFTKFNADFIFKENIDYLTFNSIQDFINKVYSVKKVKESQNSRRLLTVEEKMLNKTIHGRIELQFSKNKLQ